MIRAPSGLPPAFWAVLIVGVLLRLIFFSGYPGTDDTYYIAAARRLSVGDSGAFDSYFAVRSGLVVPTAAAYWLFGVSPFSTTALPFLFAIAGIVVAYHLGREVGGDQVGVFAALLLAFLPLDVIFSTQLFACVPISCLTGLCALLLMRAADDNWRAWAAGLSLGLATLMGDTAWFCLLPAGYLLWHHRSTAIATRFVSGVLVVTAIEASAYFLFTGDGLLRWRMLSDAVAGQGEDAMSSGLGVAYFLQPFLRLISEQEFGLFALLIVSALVWHGLKGPDWKTRFLIVWVVSVFIYTAYGSTSPLRYAPLPRLPRYLSSLMIPALVLSSAMLLQMTVRRRWLIVTGLCVTSIICVWVDNGRDVKAARRALHQFVTSTPGVPFVLDRPLMFDVQVFSGFSPNPQLRVLALDDDEAQRVRTAPALYGTADVVRDSRGVPGGFVAVTRSELNERTRSILGPPVATFAPADRLYYRLLRQPWFISILSLVRDRYRVEGMQQLVGERVYVYRSHP